MEDFVTNKATFVRDSSGRIILVIADDLSLATLAGNPIPEGTLGWDKDSGSLSRYVAGAWVTSIVQSSIGASDLGASTVQGATLSDKVVRSVRRRCTIDEINAGVTILAANTGYKYRIVGVTAIAYGGAVGGTTTVDILGTQAAGSVQLVTFAQANLTQSTLLFDGGSGSVILADGASYVANDVSTAITVGKTGGSLTTATGVDIKIEYAIEA